MDMCSLDVEFYLSELKMVDIAENLSKTDYIIYVKITACEEDEIHFLLHCSLYSSFRSN